MDNLPPSQPPISKHHLTHGNLSFSQESLWFLQQLDPQSFAYNSSFLYKIIGGIDRSNLEQSLNLMIQRHEILRTTYQNQGGNPKQIIQPFHPHSLPFVDYSDLPEHERVNLVQKYASENGILPYELQRGPLARFALLHTAPSEDYFFLGMHHINSDAWSREIFIKDLMQYYKIIHSGSRVSLPEPPIQYLDYALWQRDWLSGDVLATFIAHWKEILSGELPVLELPADKQRPLLQTSHGSRYYFRFSQSLNKRIEEFCKRERITPFHLYLAAYAILLMRYSGQEDIIVGCPFANRSRSELGNIIGVFVNTLPIRLNMKGNPKIHDFLGQVRTVMLDAFAWQAAPFEALVSEISPERDLSRSPVFQVAINMRNVPSHNSQVENLKIERVLREDVPAQFDLSLEFDDDGDGLVASLLFNTDLFNEGTIVLMAAHFQNLVGNLLGDIDLSINDIEMLSPTEQKRILIDWNNTNSDFPTKCIHELISEQAKITPDGVAVICNDRSLTYRKLEEKSNQLAHFLRSNGVEAESRVGIYLPRSENIVVTVLAILKAGGAYIPIDLSLPSERVAFMVDDSAPAVVITLSNLESQLPETVRKICLDTEANSIDSCPVVIPDSVIDNDGLIYVIYTSGSTGRPKGVMNTHKGIVNYLSYMKEKFGFSQTDRYIQLTSLSFDVSVLEILGPLYFGATVLLMDDEQMRNPEYISQAIIDHQATCISPVPTMLRAICESTLTGGTGMNSLRLVMPAGEVLREADVELTHRAFGDSLILVNQYGPTECSIIHTTYTLPPALPGGSESVPIGKPINNAYAYILDQHLHPVPLGAKGELFIGGVGVGKGYWNLPDMTAEKFLPDPFILGGRMYRTGDVVRQTQDGTIHFLGRLDNQVKIRGYRVELGEIEAVMSEFPGVTNAAVTIKHQSGKDTLAGYVTISNGKPEQIKANLRVFLEKRLPFYMLPSVLMVLTELPLTFNGKVDYKALPLSMEELRQDVYVPPGNDIEKKVVEIWKEILGLDRVGIRDNFFELGGHSLLAVRMFTRIEEEFGQSLPMLLLFKEGTVEALAAALSGKEKSDYSEGIFPLQSEGSETPLYILSAGIYMRELARDLGTRRPVFALRPYENGKLTYRGSIEEMAEIYYRCLTNFDPHGPYFLLGHSAHGIFALELARLLRRDGKQVAFLGFLDTYPPGTRKRVKWTDRVKIHLENIQNENLWGILLYAYRSLQRWIFRNKPTVRDIVSGKLPEREGAILDTVNALVQAYKPDAFDGQVTIFSAERRPWFIRWDPMEQWKDILTGEMEIVPVPGDHMSMFKPPQVVILAEKIAGFLQTNDPKHRN